MAKDKGEFQVFKRSNKPFYYVRFRDPDGTLGGSVSTKQTTKSKAIMQAYKWLANGIPTKDGDTVKVSLLQAIKQSEITQAEAEIVLKTLKDRGLAKSYVLPTEKGAIDFIEFLLNFWDWDKSDYIKEKLRKKNGIHKRYPLNHKSYIENYYREFWAGCDLCAITKQDFQDFMTFLDNQPRFARLAADSKNQILKAGTTAVRWAYKRDYIEKDFTVGMEWYSGDSKIRNILTPEIARAVFSIEWQDKRTYLANMLAMCTGMRAGEIQGLKIQDLGNGCLYLNRAWNDTDRLKVLKNKESRRVELPFDGIMQSLISLAKYNPHGYNMESFVFWAERMPDRPMDSKPFLKDLRKALCQVGFTMEQAEQYEFHGWRHYYTAYMSPNLSTKLLQTQTGHKTDKMIKRYGDHELQGEREIIRRALLDTFGDHLPIIQGEV